MNWLDIIILVSLLAGVVGGIVTGLIRSLLSLVGLIVAVVVAGRGYHTVGGWLGFIHNEDVASFVGFALIFLAIMLAVGLIGKLLHSLVSSITLGWLDHLAGGTLGLLMAVIAWGALLTIWLKFLPGAAGTVTDSGLAGFLVAKFPLVLALLPDSFQGVKSFFG